MKIIDFHVHAGNFKLLRDDIQELLTRRPFEPDVNIAEVFSEPEQMEAYLKNKGVFQGVILAECGPGTNYTIDSQMIAEFSEKREIFIPFGSINPNYHNTQSEFWKSLKLGIKGFKFYPADHNFNALREDMQFVYKMCEKLGLPVMFHTGLTILEFVRSDSSKYVQRSVANWLNDASKSRPDWVINTCMRWQKESPTQETNWIINRGLRTLNKKAIR